MKILRSGQNPTNTNREELVKVAGIWENFYEGSGRQITGENHVGQAKSLEIIDGIMADEIMQAERGQG